MLVVVSITRFLPNILKTEAKIVLWWAVFELSDTFQWFFCKAEIKQIMLLFNNGLDFLNFCLEGGRVLLVGIQRIDFKVFQTSIIVGFILISSKLILHWLLLLTIEDLSDVRLVSF
jgi:hypothetical protein